MALNANEVPISGSTRELLPRGSYPCRLVAVIDLGLQAGREYKGKIKDPKQEIFTTYEFLDEFLKNEDGEEMLDKPRWLSEWFPFNSLKAEKAKSTERYLALDPNQTYMGNWPDLIGTPCTVTVVHDEGKNGRMYEKISAVSGMRPKEAEKAPKLVNPPMVFDFDAPNMEVWERLPQWIQDKIKGALNYKGSALSKALGETSLAEELGEDEDQW